MNNEKIEIDTWEDFLFLKDNNVAQIIKPLKDQPFNSLKDFFEHICDDGLKLNFQTFRKIIDILEVYHIIKLEKHGNNLKPIKLLNGDFTIGYDLHKISFSEEKKEKVDHKDLLISYGIKDFKNTPINPKHLVQFVQEKLVEYEQVVPSRIPKMVSELCKVFNQCIKTNNEKRFSEPKENENLKSANGIYETLVVSPRTGSAKSLTLKSYVSLLKNESSIIVLKHVDDLNKFCEDINSWSNNPNYSRCNYAISQNNLRSKYHVNRNELSQYRTICISHSLYIQLKHLDMLDTIKYYKGKSRNLCVIDERIKHYKQYKITDEEIPEFSDFIALEIQKYKSENNDGKDNWLIKILESIYRFSNYFILRFDSIKRMQTHSFDFYFANEFRDIKVKEKEEISNYLETIKFLFKMNSITNRYMLSKKVNQIINEQIKNTSHILETMFHMTSYGTIIQKIGKTLTIYCIDNCENNFMSQVILDATAHVNPYYLFASKSIFKNVKHIEITNPKTYKNLTFYLTSGYSQGRSSIYKDKNKDLLWEVERYLEIANDILTNDDNLLILGHKNFINYMEKYSNSKQILFTYWGKHTGQNNWSHCNKIMVIGWNYLPRVEHYMTIGSAANGFENAFENIVLKYKNLIQTVSTQQIADDLIQGISRGSLRNTIDTQGNCPKTKVYLFYKSSDQSDKILNIVEKEFKACKVKQWVPKDKGSKRKAKKTEITSMKIVEYVDKLLKERPKIQSSKLITDLEIKKSTFHRIACSDYFEKLCASKKIAYDYYDKKTKVFTRIED